MTSLDITVDDTEVQALMLHHLRLAASLFETLPGDLKVHRGVIVEQEEQEVDPWAEAALVWFDKLEELYKDDEDISNG